MSRSVFVPWGAVNVAYAAFECSDCPEEFSDSLVNAEYALREKYPSLEAARGWIGSASNGEAFFKPANGVERGAMGLGFTSREGWL